MNSPKEGQTQSRSAKDLKNAAAHCKRLASGLRQLVAPCAPNLDDEERQTLLRAAQVLTSLSENLEEGMKRARARDARVARREKDMRTAMVNGNFGALRRVDERVAFIGHCSWTGDGRARIEVGIGEEPRWAMKRLEDEFERALTRHAQDVAGGDAPVSEAVAQAWMVFVESAVDLKRRNAAVIEVLERLEAIA
jgi:hypothetical protein